MSASVAEIDLAAIEHNVATIGSLVGGASVCAVVKADGYGHGAVPAAAAALRAGADCLAVAQVDEGRELRAAGIDAPVLVLSEPGLDELDRALVAGLELAVYRPALVDALQARAAAVGVPEVRVHLKVDTGMRRVGCEPDDAVDLATRIASSTHVRLAGTMTHLARADEPGVPTTDEQLDAFDRVLGALAAAGIDPGVRHAANSAAAIAHPRARLDLVRVGIASYGIAPSDELGDHAALRPAIRWTSSVRFVKRVRAGEHVSYGHRHTFLHDTVVATVPVGYADGVRRDLGLLGGGVLVGGRHCPVVGVVTMDQFVVDCGLDADVAVGDEVVLLGTQGERSNHPADWARVLDTIGYEVVCSISSRVPRRYR